MSAIYEENNCKLIRHDRQSHSYQDNDGSLVSYRLKELLFSNFKRKQKSRPLDGANEMKSQVEKFLNACGRDRNTFPMTAETEKERLKAANIALMNQFYDVPGDFGAFHGENNLDHGKMTIINENVYLIPPRCRFFNKKIEDIETCLPTNEANKFDFIVIDPPWKNRYIKRVKKSTKQGYFMMNDEEVVKIPLENYIKKSSIVVIWCTNSETHIKAVKEKCLAKWKLKHLSTWQWVKVDKDGQLFCALDGNKKPFEQIFIATHEENKNLDEYLAKDFLIFSQPSSVHSHKPPLIGNNVRLKVSQLIDFSPFPLRSLPTHAADPTQVPRDICKESLRRIHLDRIRSFKASEHFVVRKSELNKCRENPQTHLSVVLEAVRNGSGCKGEMIFRVVQIVMMTSVVMPVDVSFMWISAKINKRKLNVGGKINSHWGSRKALKNSW